MRRIRRFGFYLSLRKNAKGCQCHQYNQHMLFYSLANTSAGFNEDHHLSVQFQEASYLIWLSKVSLGGGSCLFFTLYFSRFDSSTETPRVISLATNKYTLELAWILVGRFLLYLLRSDEWLVRRRWLQVVVRAFYSYMLHYSTIYVAIPITSSHPSTPDFTFISTFISSPPSSALIRLQSSPAWPGN